MEIKTSCGGCAATNSEPGPTVPPCFLLAGPSTATIVIAVLIPLAAVSACSAGIIVLYIRRTRGTGFSKAGPLLVQHDEAAAPVEEGSNSLRRQPPTPDDSLSMPQNGGGGGGRVYIVLHDQQQAEVQVQMEEEAPHGGGGQQRSAVPQGQQGRRAGSGPHGSKPLLSLSMSANCPPPQRVIGNPAAGTPGVAVAAPAAAASCSPTATAAPIDPMYALVAVADGAKPLARFTEAIGQLPRPCPGSASSPSEQGPAPADGCSMPPPISTSGGHQSLWVPDVMAAAAPQQGGASPPQPQPHRRLLEPATGVGSSYDMAATATRQGCDMAATATHQGYDMAATATHQGYDMDDTATRQGGGQGDEMSQLVHVDAQLLPVPPCRVPMQWQALGATAAATEQAGLAGATQGRAAGSSWPFNNKVAAAEPAPPATPLPDPLLFMLPQPPLQPAQPPPP